MHAEGLVIGFIVGVIFGFIAAHFWFEYVHREEQERK